MPGFLDKDAEINEAIRNELKRQMEGLEMIPSENFTSLAVMEAMGSVLTNKYSEVYTGKRYYGGNQFVDAVERTASIKNFRDEISRNENIKRIRGQVLELCKKFPLYPELGK